jgi:predicted DNA repair protein MutK
MAGGLIALLDDIAAIAKVAAASLDDIAGQTAKAGAKAAGVVIDDAAVTPRYVVGFAADRELPIVGKIAWGSIRNKLLILLPAALALSAFAPWAITPLLMAGGLFLCFEGYEKVHALATGHGHVDAVAIDTPADGAALEQQKVSGAIRTDMILSAEIMAITLAEVAQLSFWMKAAVLGAVGIMITVLVYGAVAAIVKADDVGVRLARGGRLGATRALGRGLVKGMPPFLTLLSLVGTFAMLWVGGGILVHGMAGYGHASVEHALHGAGLWTAGLVPFGKGFVGWLVEAAGAAVVGVVAGAIVVAALTLIRRMIGKPAGAH